MAPAKLSFLFVILSAFTCLEAYNNLNQLKETKMTVYFQDYSGGPNTTDWILTGIPGRAWSFFDFGTITITDDPVTEGPDKNSPEIARAQGIYATSSLDGGNTHCMFSLVFTNKAYNGSTLEIQGRSIQLADVREVSVVGGTGKFRFARGYATFESVHIDLTTFYSVVRCNVTVLHP